MEEFIAKGLVVPVPWTASWAIGEDELMPSFRILAREETFKLVVVTLVPTAVVNVKAPPRLVKPEIYRLVEVSLVVEKLVLVNLEKKPLVLVTDVPVAVVKPKAPESVPPVSKR